MNTTNMNTTNNIIMHSNANIMIINLTQHALTAEQKAEGAVELPDKLITTIRQLITFDEMPNAELLKARAKEVAMLLVQHGCRQGTRCLIGGAPYFMAHLERALFGAGFVPCYAFSQRESVEITKEDGSVEKRAVFRHKGFFNAENPFA